VMSFLSLRQLLILILALALTTVTESEKNIDFLRNIPPAICSPPDKSRKRPPRSVHSGMLLDEKHHVIMDWTPKAACTKAVEMFWNQMGIFRGIYYPTNSFIHNYRYYYYMNCGHVSQDMLTNKSYYKFKIVRNPFNRAVSSYLHLMKTNIAHTITWASSVSGERDKEGSDRLNPLNDQTFEQFLNMYMKIVHPDSNKYHNVALTHFQPQSLDVEVKAFKSKTKSIFDYIVHLENFDEDIAVVNKASKMNYSFPYEVVDTHEVMKTKQSDRYFGNTTFSTMMKSSGVPENYGKFYNRNTKRIVSKIFANDLKIYNYTFPFSKIY
jgi:hypothetical protein